MALSLSRLTEVTSAWRWRQPDDMACMDVMEFLGRIPDAQVDAVITDSPYGLEFGPAKEWDLPDRRRVQRRSATYDAADRKTAYKLRRAAGVNYTKDAESFIQFAAWVEDWSSECLRVLRPGGFLVAFGGMRTFDALQWGIRMAGFEIRAGVCHVQSQGMAQGMDISQAMDRQRTRAEAKASQEWMNARCTELGFSAADIDRACGTVNSAVHYLTHPSQPGIPTAERWALIEPLLGPPPPWLRALIRLANESADAWKARRVVAEQDASYGYQIAGGRVTGKRRVTVPTTADGIRWVGFNTALKANVEPICIARKPFIGNLVDNLRLHGTGALDIDSCRLPARSKSGWVKSGTVGTTAAAGYLGSSSFRIRERTPEELVGLQDNGQWPPSYLIVCDDDCKGEGAHSDDCPAKVLNTQAKRQASRFFVLPGWPEEVDAEAYGTGFYAPKVHPKDRTLPGYLMIIPETPETVRANKPTVGKQLAETLCRQWEIPYGEGEGNALETLTGWPIPEHGVPTGLRTAFQPALSQHPTPKPLLLAAWCARLASPRPDIVDRDVVVVDPFGGSGGLTLAAMLEGRQGAYNDFTPKYCATADARFGGRRPRKVWK